MGSNHSSSEQPFANAIDWQTPDNPQQALAEAVARGEQQKAIGAYRLITAAGKKPSLDTTQTLTLAQMLEEQTLYLDAARVYRQAAEQDLSHPEAPRAIFQSGQLLLGPVQNHAAGEAMLKFLIERFGDHQLADQAEQLLQNGQQPDTQLGSFASAESNDPSPNQIQTTQETTDEDHLPFSGSQVAKRIQSVIGGVGSKSYQRLSRGVQLGLIACVTLWLIGWYGANRMQGIDEIAKEVLQAPVQKPSHVQATIHIEKDGYAYEIKPKYDYSIAGLIVSLRDYTFMSYRQSDSVFPMDLCLIWGNNVQQSVYRNSNIKFSQHGRFCIYEYQGHTRVHPAEVSNNHLLLKDDELEDVLDTLNRGDQVLIHGQLVDVKAHRVASVSGADPKRFALNSSTSRDDKGGGACEIIYVDRIQILQAANSWAYAIKEGAFYIGLVLLLVSLLRYLLLPVRLREMQAAVQ